MNALSAQTIRKAKLLSPMQEPNMDPQGRSRGLSACGYDLTVDRDVKVASLPASIVLLFFSSLMFAALQTATGWLFWFDALAWVWFGLSGLYGVVNSFKLVGAAEYFDIPDTFVGRMHDKSTLARLGLAVQNTVAEPGWRGYLTLELSNHGWRPIVLRKGDAVAQVIFEWLDNPTELPYAGKYQNQERGPQEAR